MLKNTCVIMTPNELMRPARSLRMGRIQKRRDEIADYWVALKLAAPHRLVKEEAKLVKLYETGQKLRFD